MTISSVLKNFESLSVCPDVIKMSTKNGTLADLFEAHKTDFLTSDKRTCHHFETLRSVIRESGLLSESTIAKKITTNDVRAILNNVYQRTQKRAWVNQIHTYMHTLFSWGVKSDKYRCWIKLISGSISSLTLLRLSRCWKRQPM